MQQKLGDSLGLSKSASILWKIIFLIMIIAIAFPFLHLMKSSGNAGIERGLLDLSQYDFEERGSLCLDGEWEFYYNQFLIPELNDKKGSEKDPDALISIPTVWNNYQIKGAHIPGFGYGTYRLRVTGASAGIPLAMKILPQSTAYQLYINDELLVTNGTVSKDKNYAKAVYKPESVTFTPNESEFVITFLVSNYIYARGGMWDAPTLGTDTQIKSLDRFIGYRDIFLLGNYFIMFFLCLMIYAIRPDSYSRLYFALLCLLSTGRVLLYGEHLIRYFTDSFRFIAVIEYITRYWYPILVLLLLKELFPKSISSKFVKYLLFAAAIITTATFVLPVWVFTSLSAIVMGYNLLFGLFIITVLLRIRNEKTNWTFLFGVVVFYLTGVYDILFASSAYVELNPVGFYVSLLIFAFILAENYGEALKKSEESLLELAEVSEHRLQTELKLLQSQIKPHFLYNALSAIANVCGKDGKKAEELILNLAFFMRANFDFSSFDRFTTLENELEFIKSYVTIETARFGDRVNYTEQIDIPLTTQIPRLIIEPLVENAVRHGVSRKKGGGQIRLTVTELSEEIYVEVYDNGVGMDQEKAADLFCNEKRGIGLKNIQERLIKLYGSGLKIESVPNEYTRVSFMMKKESQHA